MNVLRRTRGFTLIELMTAISVVSILTVIAVPNMQSMMQKRQLEGAAGEIYNNLLLMRSQALEKNHSAFVSFGGSGTNWTYGLDDSASCTPTLADDCKVNDTERSYRGSGWKNVTLTVPTAIVTDSLRFEPRRGMASPSGTITLSSAAGTINVNVSAIGYITICSAGSQRLGGYITCS